MEKPIVTYLLIASCVIMFVFQQLVGVNLWGYLAFFPAYVWELPWSFISSIFLHAGIEHLLFNMIALFFFGVALERIVGKKMLFLIFILSGIIGNLGYLITASDPTMPAIGASGAIYGIVGTLVVIVPFQRVYLYGFFPLPLILVVAFWILLDLFGLFSPSDIANGAHLGGILVGILFGFYTRRKLNYYKYITT